MQYSVSSKEPVRSAGTMVPPPLVINYQLVFSCFLVIISLFF